MANRFVNKQYAVTAVRWYGDNVYEVRELVGLDAVRAAIREHQPFTLSTVNGLVIINVGDWVVVRDTGEIDAYEDEIFIEVFKERDGVRK